MQPELPDHAPADPHRSALTVYSVAEAQAIWARAAELQMSAEQDVRREYGLSPAAGSGARSLVPSVPPPAGMYFAPEIQAAAEDAGIAAVHVAVAMAEHDGAFRNMWLEPTDAQRQQFIRELGTDAGAIQAVGYVPGTPDTALEQIRYAFAQEPWGLEFEGLVQSTADSAQVLRFRLPGWLQDWPTSEGPPPSLTNKFVYNANRIGVLTCHVLLVPRGTPAAPSCEVTIVADLRLGQHFNATAMQWAYPLLSVCFAIPGALLAMLAATPDAPLWSMPALLGALAGVTLSLPVRWGVRRVMRWEQRTAMGVLESEFRRMLRAIGRPRESLPVRGAVAVTSRAAGVQPSDTDSKGQHELRAAFAR